MKLTAETIGDAESFSLSGKYVDCRFSRERSFPERERGRCERERKEGRDGRR